MVCPPARFGRFAFAVSWALSLSLMAACSQEAMLQKFASAEEQASARHYIDQLRSGDYPDIEKVIDPTMADELHGDTLGKRAALIPEGTPTSVQLVGAKSPSP
jgi:hypothetical protein